MQSCYSILSKCKVRDFPGSPVVKTLCFQCRGTGLIPGQAHAVWSDQKILKKKKKEK